MSWIAWAVLSAVFASATTILSKCGVAGLDPNLATAVRTTVVLLLAWGVAFTFGQPRELSTLGHSSLLYLSASGLATGLSWLCYFRALALGPASKVTPLDKLSVVFVLLLAWPFLGERLTAAKLAGGALITAGAIVLTRA